MNPQSINDVVRKVLEAMPEGVKQLPEEMKTHIETAVSATIQRLNLVTREEFDAQKKVLERTRQKLESLEKQLSQGHD